jgi:hypothetical protein
MADVAETKVVDTAKDQAPVVDIKALEEQLEQIKKIQAGSDKAYQEAAKKAAELAAENEKLKKEKMNEKEKAEYEFAKQRAELEAKSREVAEATLRLSKHTILGEKSIPLEFAQYIGGSTEDEIKTNADTFLKHFNEAVGKGVAERLAGSKPPQVGTETKIEELPEDWRQLEKKLSGRQA